MDYNKNCKKYGCLTGFGMANGAFGELIQGILPNGRSFMITFPVKCYSKVFFFPDVTSKVIDVFPPHKIKSHRLAIDLLRYFDVQIGGKLVIKSDMPEGKGLASSSSDLVATSCAIGQSIKKKVGGKILCELIKNIEPSDGIMYPGVVSFYYKDIKLIEFFGRLSMLTVIAIDEGGEINTLEYNNRSNNYSVDDMEKYELLFKKTSMAIKNKNLREIGESSTQSAIMNQKHNPKKYLNKMLDICKKINGLGIIVAHSGTFTGILLDSNDAKYHHQILFCKKELAEIEERVCMFESI